MITSEPQPPEPTDPLAVARRDLSERFSDLELVESATLKDGPRVRKTARYVTVKNRHTGAVHHHALTLETGKKRQGDWTLDDKRSISLSDEDDDEIGRLGDFLQGLRGKESLARHLKQLPPSELAELFASVLGSDIENLRGLYRHAKDHPPYFVGLAAAINLGRSSEALERFKRLVESHATPSEVLALLEQHAWLWGLEGSGATRVTSSKLEPHLAAVHCPLGMARPALWAVGSTLSGRPLLLFDPTRQQHLPDAELDRALVAVMAELTELEATHPQMPSYASKRQRAVLVMGREGDENHKAALQAFNQHLACIEVVTFDQLQRAAQGVLDALRQDARRTNPAGPSG